MKIIKTGTGTADLPARQKSTFHPKLIVPGTGTKALGGFSLVELIVVITILVILGTIAFINLGGFAGSARDSARISNLNSLKTGLDLVQIKSGSYPLPEGKVDITASGANNIIGYQGYAGEQVGSTAKLSPGATKDPLDPTMYITYSVNATQSKMQAMSFLEDSSTATAFVSSLTPTANASTTSDYSKRYPKTNGDSLGILLDNGTGSTKNQPVQELLTATFTGVDIVTSQSGYTAYFNNKITENGTGSHLNEAYKVFSVIYNTSPSNWHTVDVNCWKPDVTVGSQVWAGCNSTIGSTAIAYGQTSCYNYAGVVKTPCTTPPSGKTVSTMTEADYLAGQSDNIYGALYEWSGATNGGLYANNCLGTNISASNTTCPCKAGYHLPTNTEWDTLETSLGCSGTDKKTGDTTGWECTTASPYTDLTGLGWIATNPNSLKNKLGLSLAGYCTSGTSCFDRGNYGAYWSSTVSAPSSAWHLYLYSVYASVNRTNDAQEDDFSVRCIKD